MYSIFLQVILTLALLVQITLQSEYLVSKEFSTKTFPDSSSWSINRVTACQTTSYTEYSGVNIMGTLGNSETQRKLFSGLPPHWSASLRFDLILLGSLDRSENDHIEIYFDSTTYDFYDKPTYSEGLGLCYNLPSYGDSLVLYYKNITHTGSTIDIKMMAKTNEPLSYEGYGIRNFFLYVDTCHKSCLTCNGPSSNQCQTCPANATKTGNTCACNTGFNLHTNSCVSSCPTGYVKDSNSNNCVSDNCVGCSSCDSVNNICSSCSAGYLHKGHCVSSCPLTAPLTAGYCQDFDSNLINGQYLVKGLMSDSFGESEIKGIGLSVTGFMGFKDVSSTGAYVTHCGTNHLLGGAFLSGKGSSISGSWTGLAPHWSVRVGYNFWKIDSWDNESVQFKLDGTIKQTFTYDASSGTESVCGNTWNELQYSYNYNQTHTASTLSIDFIGNFDEVVSNESYGVRDLYILIDYCTPNCTSCDASGCLVCQATYLMYHKKCYASCPIGSYQNSATTCADCNPSCKTCNSPGNICTSCYAPNFLNPGSGLTCLSTCPTSYWQRTSDRTCQQCHSSCYTCQNPGDQNSCLSCSGSLYLQNNQCLSTCPSNNYKNTVTNNNQCSSCNSSCKTCDGPSLSNCLSCTLPSYYQSTTKTCGGTCLSNQYKNDSVPACQNCESTCTTCSGGLATNCLTCSGSYFLDKTTNTCTTTCPAGTFNDSSNHECTSCHLDCLTCSGKNSNQCLSCSSPTFYQSSTKTCVSACNTNQYSVTTPARSCLDCNTNCKTCDGPNLSNCLSCSLPSYFQAVSKTCVNTCNSNQFADNNQIKCVDCESTCKTCSGPNNNNCLSCTGSLYFDSLTKTCKSSCPSDTYKNTSTNECTKCNSSCKTCSGNLITNCLTCMLPSYFQSSTNSCDSSCPSNQYKNDSVPACSNCESTCTTCSGGLATNCLTCSGSYFLDKNKNTCITTCPAGTYNDSSNHECTSCHPDCLTCSGKNSNQCLSCSSPTFYQSSTKTCVSACNTNQYSVTTPARSCLDCNTNCKTCDGPNLSNCLSCSLPSYYQTATKTCVSTCDSNQFAHNTQIKCVDCESTCKTCSGPNNNNCLSCTGSLYFDSLTKTCKSSCPSDTYKNTSTNECVKCHTTCQTCSGNLSTNCLTCELPLYFQSSTNSCDSSCPSNQYKNDSVPACSNCESTCTTCSGGLASNCLSCSGSYFLDKTTNKCITTCPAGTFNDSSNHECTSCHLDCLTCSGKNSNQCLSCSSPTFYQSSTKTCVSACDTNQYSVTTPVRACSDCNTNCKTCSGPSNSECLSCSGINYLNTTSHTCSTNCPNGTYQNSSNNQCSPCHGDCKTCSGPNNNQCQSCTLPNYFQPSSSSCVTLCNTNQYKNDSIATCSQCHTNCTSCTDNPANSCLSCSGSLFLDKSTNTCNSSCLTTQFKNSINNQCTDCHSTCATCNGGTSNNCLTCKSPLSFQSTTSSCDSNCKSNQYINPSPTPQCQQCHSSCSTCSGPSDSQCLSCSGTDLFLQDPTSASSSCKQQCPDGTYQNSSNKQCSKCDSTCKTCFGGDITQCSACSLPLYLHPATKKCVQQCDNNQYKDATAATCLNCHSSCQECSSGSETSCLSCSGSFLQSNTCVSTCSKGTYGSKNSNTCEKCDTTCDACSGPSSKECLSCTGTKLEYQNNCVETCPLGYFKNTSNNSCSKCHQSCESCTGDSINQCTTCSNSLFLYQNQCISECSIGLYKSLKTNSCEKCEAKCQSCNGPSEKECLTCNQGTVLQEQSCLKECSKGYYQNQEKQQCSKCDPSCLTCVGPSISQCETCSDQLMKHNNKCVSECPSKTYLHKTNARQCMDCDNSCSSNCSGPTKEDCDSIKPQDQIIVIILGVKTVCWIISVIIGIFKDKKSLENEKNRVLPTKLNINDIEMDSPIRRNINPDDSTLNGSPIPMRKQDSFSSPEKKPITLQQADGRTKINSSYFPSTFQDLNQEYNMTFQNQEDISPKISKRRSRRTEFVLRSRGNKHLFGGIPLSSSLSNSPSLQNTNRGSQSQVFDKLVTSTPTLNPNHSSSIFANENKEQLKANQKLKFSILGNEWVSLFNFYDSQVNRINRSTLIYLKYQMFFFVCNQFSLSPLQYIMVCLISGIGMKFIIGNLISLPTRFTRIFNSLCLAIFIGGIVCNLYFWFIPTLITLKYAQDLKWSILYLITFTIDFLVLQQLFGLISYLCTVKYINQEKKEKSINKYFKNNYLLNQLKN